MSADINKLAKIVYDAQITATAISQLSETEEFTLEEAYRVQAKSIDMRLDAGEHRVGMKMGFTSRAKMIQMGVDDMIWGRLTNSMLVEDGGEIDFSKYVHPRVEPEIAYLLKSDLEGPVSTMEAWMAVEAIAPAMEIIDSRYENFKFTVEDVVADNSSSSGFVIGSWNKPDTDIANLGMVMEFDGRAVQIGSSAAILGHPARSLATASRMVAEDGEKLNAGDIVMAGGATAAEALFEGVRVRNSVETLGSCSFGVAK
ncbi:MAG: fumarylacetoacetate hydrolase family protein [Rhodospirillales bacterium]